MNSLKITSKQNPKVKGLLNLRKRRDRDEQGLFLIEGYREVSRALKKGIAPKELYYCPEWFLGENEPDLIQQAETKGARLYKLSKEVFEKCSYRDRPDGLIAVAPQWKKNLEDLKLGPKPFLLVVESIEKPGNLGTILRSADGAGVDAVIVCDAVTDIFNPNVVRSSTGVLFSVPIIVSDSQTVYAWLRKNKIQIVCTTPDTENIYTKTDLRGPIAIAMGSEQYGLTDFWLQNSDINVRIPMKGLADSLNVAMATGLLVYETLRQREE
jgi:TrmH family RNA methyltransferase